MSSNILQLKRIFQIGIGMCLIISSFSVTESHAIVDEWEARVHLRDHLGNVVTITDEDTYAEYRAGFGAILRQYEGELVAADTDPTILEGEWSATLTVLLRFATREQALEWYNSEEYQERVQIRHAASTADLIVIDGRL